MTPAERALRSLPLLAAADDAVVAGLAAAARRRRLGRGQVLFVQGEPDDSLVLVLSGRLKVLVESDRGEALVLSVVGPGESLGELGVVDGQPRSAGAEALEATELLVVPGGAVREALRTCPGLALALLEDVVQRVRALTGSAADLVFLDLPRRLAKLLAGLDGEGFDLPQVELAARLGVARPSLNRALSGLQRRGWVDVGRGRVTVVDRPALERFAAS